MVLPRAEVHPHVQVPVDERAPGDVGAGFEERQLVLLAVELEVEVGEQVVEHLFLAVGDDGGRGGLGVVRDRHRVVLAAGHDAEAKGAVGIGELADGDGGRHRQQGTLLERLQGQPTPHRAGS